MVILCAGLVFAATACFSYFALDHTPRIHDEMVYQFQARLFQSGRLYVPSPACPRSFDFSHMVNNGRWYSQYPPGYPMMLLLGLFFGAPWLLNPLLAALSIVLLYHLGKEIYGRAVGIWAAFLGTVSIWLLLMSSTMMSHTSSMLFMAVFLLFLFRSVRLPSVKNGMLAGMGFGMMFLIRPYNAVLLSFPFVAFLLVRWIRSPQQRTKNFLGFGAVGAAAVVLLMAYNTLTNGHPLTMGYTVSHGEEHGLGFGRSGYVDYEHSPLTGALNISDNLRDLSLYLFGWPVTSFWALLLLLLFIRRRDRRAVFKDLLLFSSFVCLSAGLFMYWGTFVFIGARMFFETIPLLALLSAEGLNELRKFMDERLFSGRPIRSRFLLAVILLALTAYAFLVRLPALINPPRTEWFYERFDHYFAGVNPDFHDAIASHVPDGSLIIFKFLYHPLDSFPNGWWSAGFVQNSPDLDDAIIYAQDLGPANRKLFDCYPDRTIYLYMGLIDRGLLLPLRPANGDTLAAAPLPPKASYKKFELVNDPLRFFKLYSPDFARFMRAVYAAHRVWDVDAEFLIEKGREAFNQQNFLSAQYYTEAALQLEVQPYKRLQFLNFLAGCYNRTGNIADLKRIQQRIATYDEELSFQVIPEKGF
jgi:hypothetical protein